MIFLNTNAHPSGVSNKTTASIDPESRWRCDTFNPDAQKQLLKYDKWMKDSHFNYHSSVNLNVHSSSYHFHQNSYFV